MRNIKLTFSFDGSSYSGWQRQKNAPTIQEEIEKRLSRICNTAITLHGAGRTDAGVHALAMVAHFETDSKIESEQLHRSLNSMLPPAIRITAVKEMDSNFHARFSTVAKTYIYKIDTSPIQSPFNRLYSLHVPQELSETAIGQCLQILSGTHDFASFETSGSRDKSITTGKGSVRTIHRATFQQTAEHSWQFEFNGDGFLRHMVRNIMGTLLEVGQGRTTVEEFKTILRAKNRADAGRTAPAHGLFLKQIYYK